MILKVIKNKNNRDGTYTCWSESTLTISTHVTVNHLTVLVSTYCDTTIDMSNNKVALLILLLKRRGLVRRPQRTLRPCGGQAIAQDRMNVTRTLDLGRAVLRRDTGFAELRLAAKDPKAQLNVLRYTLGNGTLYGDILDGTEQTSFRGVTRPVVYTYDIPTDASGVIRDTVTATINGVVCALPVEITVVPRTLPAVKDWKFHLDFWQHADPIARWHDVPMWSDAHFELLKAYYRPLVEMGQKTITTTLIDEAWNQQTYDRYRSCVEATKHIDGTWSYDYTNFDVHDGIGRDGTDRLLFDAAVVAGLPLF